MSNEFQLTELQVATPVKGASFRLYVYNHNGYHRGGTWFTSKLPLPYPDEMIRRSEARRLTEEAVASEREVRITDAGDMLVFHSKQGRQLVPAPGVDFWETV